MKLQLQQSITATATLAMGQQQQQPIISTGSSAMKGHASDAATEAGSSGVFGRDWVMPLLEKKVFTIYTNLENMVRRPLCKH